MDNSVEGLKQQKVMVIDDTTTIHRLMKHLLNELGFNDVTCCSGAVEAKEELDKSPNDWGVIFCDLNMPEVSGIDFLKQLRSDEQFKDQIFIMLTMESDIKLVNESIMAGVNGYILKPYTKNTIVKALDAAISTQSNP